MRYPLVIDFETQKTFRETTNHQELGISVAGAYDYKTDKIYMFEEHELTQLFRLLEEASIVIGFNHDAFDLPVLQRYYPGDVTQFQTFDILTDVKNRLGRRIRLDNLVKATLEEGKSGHGLQAIKLYKEGRMDELKQYCEDDVRLTKELFEYGAKNGNIYYVDIAEKRKIPVNWEQYMTKSGKKDVSLTLPI